MSGIGGIVKFNGERVEQTELDRMLNILRPYGPDREQTLKLNNSGFVHTLMRVTPEDYFERQPTRVGSNQILSSDARIDNREELCSRFNLHPAKAKTLPDSFFILKAYEKWGEACPNYLLGDFTFVIWDAKAQSLFAARDHFGLRPLFYYHQSGTFAFANDLRALLALPFVDRKLNEEKIADFLVLLHADAAKTLYEGILRIPPAHSLTVNRNQLALRRYYALEENIPDVHYSTAGEYAEALKSLLTTSVKCRLRSSTAIGSEMSGGLDSTSVACLAAIELAKEGKQLETFTSVPPADLKSFEPQGWELDERPYIEAIAQQYSNINPNYVVSDPDQQDLFKTLESTFIDQGFPRYNPFSGWAHDLAAKASHKNIRVMLSGRKGNFTISWRGRCLYSESLHNEQWGRLIRDIYNGCVNGEQGLVSILRETIVPNLPQSFWQCRDKIKGKQSSPWLNYSLINPKLEEKLQILERFEKFEYDPNYRLLPTAKANRVRQLLRGAACDTNDSLSTYRAITGVENRDPTLDKRIVEFCLGVPENIYRLPYGDRMLVRRAMVDILPPLILNRKSRGMQAQGFSTHLSETPEQLWQKLSEFKASSMIREYLDLARMERLLRKNEASELTHRESANLKRLLVRSFSVGAYLAWEEGSNR